MSGDLVWMLVAAVMTAVVTAGTIIGSVTWTVRGMLAKQNETLLVEITRSRHLLRNELQGVQGDADVNFTSVEKRLDEHGQRLSWLEAKTNGHKKK